MESLNVSVEYNTLSLSQPLILQQIIWALKLLAQVWQRNYLASKDWIARRLYWFSKGICTDKRSQCTPNWISSWAATVTTPITTSSSKWDNNNQWWTGCSELHKFYWKCFSTRYPYWTTPGKVPWVIYFQAAIKYKDNYGLQVYESHYTLYIELKCFVQFSLVSKLHPNFKLFTLPILDS